MWINWPQTGVVERGKGVERSEVCGKTTHGSQMKGAEDAGPTVER